VIWCSAALLTFFLVQQLRSSGGPWLRVPETITDHEGPTFPLSRQAIVMCERSEPLMPRGSSVTVFAPELAPNYDATHYLLAIGLLPRHRIVAPPTAITDAWPDFVIAVGSPLKRDDYVLVAEFPEGRLYRRK